MGAKGSINLDSARIKKFEDALAKGLYFNVAATQANVPVSSMHLFVKQAQELQAQMEAGEVTQSKLTARQKILLELLEAKEKGEERFVSTHVEIICKAAQSGTWQASAWLLERSKPNEFGRREKVELSGGSDPLRFANLSEEEIDAKIKELNDRLNRKRKTSKKASTARRTRRR